MKPTLQDIELIERYFDNNLSSEETHGLTERLKRDQDFKKLFDHEKLLINTIRYEAASRDLAYLKALESSRSANGGLRGARNYYYLAAAACVSLLVLAFWGLMKPADSESLYAAYFEPHPNIFEATLRSDAETSRRTMAFQAYEQKDYQRASTLFTELLRENEDVGMLMLLGNANLMLGKTELAKENFRSVIRLSDELNAAGKWYLALSYLKTGEVQQARELLRDLSEANAPYAARAQNLLADLN